MSTYRERREARAERTRYEQHGEPRADQRAHDVFWMTAAERDEYQRQLDRLDQKIRQNRP